VVNELIRNRSWATEAGTRRFVKRHRHGKAATAYRSVGGQLHLSTMGIGTYLGAPDDLTDQRYEDAIFEAVRQGINVIDTAPNYRRGRAELVVGRALRRLLDRRDVYRSEVLVASKVGFVPRSRNEADDSLDWFEAQTVGAGLARPDELVCGCHCIAPRYVAHMLDQSLENLGVETLDVLFLHNPESQLQTIAKPQLLERIRGAFETMETAADQGKIRVYGVATWSGLRAKPDDRDYLSIQELMQCAQDVAGARNRFKAIQVPLSMSMPEALTWRQQPLRGRQLSTLEAARELGLVTFTSATLHQGKLCSSAPPAEPLPAEANLTESSNEQISAIHAAIQFGRSAPGVTSALVGMSQVEHVKDNLRSLSCEHAPHDWLLAAASPPEGAAIAG